MDLPPGYDRKGLPYQCLKKGYGACLYAGRLGTGINVVAQRYEPPQRLLENSSNRWLLLLSVILLFFAILGWIRSFF